MQGDNKTILKTLGTWKCVNIELKTLTRHSVKVGPPYFRCSYVMLSSDALLLFGSSLII